ncbi:hypothetical protein AB1Y20_009802 [Prymnesium parvum]|uniref:Uncharacterized protein n=1 Tax=Prymnesium parvum TaxID=97485 RepID=A0AB34K500_PRYPA
MTLIVAPRSMPLTAVPLALGRTTSSCMREEPEDEFLDSLEQQLRAVGSRQPMPDRRPPLVEFATNSKRPPRSRRRPANLLRAERAPPAVTFTRQLLDDVVRSYHEFGRPERKLLLGSAAILIGFFLSELTQDVFGQSGYWEYVSSLVALILCETITFEHWSRPRRRRGTAILLLNTLKVGFIFGIVLNAIKMAG